MATTTLTIVDALLKEVYEDRLRDQLQSMTVASKRLVKTSEGVTHEVGGKYVTFPIRTRRNHGIGARSENEALPVPRSQKYAAARISLAYLYGSAQLTGQTMELAEKNFQAFASALQQELNGLKEGLSKDYNRQIFGTSKGVMATANAAGTTTTILMADSQAIYLEVGMIVDIFTSADASRVPNVEITALTSAAGTTTATFTPAAGGATASGDYITRMNSRNKEIVGLTSIIDDAGILYNIDPATEPVWKAVDNNNGGTNRLISEGLMIKVVDDVHKNGGSTTVAFCNLGVRRQYFNLLMQQRRYTGTKQFDGGFTGLAFTTDRGEVPIVVDVDCPWFTMFFANEDELKVYEDADWSFMNRDGSSWQRVIDATGSFDAYQTMMFSYRQLGTHRRNSHGVLRDITE